jgi:type IV pilus assembly protein PilZ
MVDKTDDTSDGTDRVDESAEGSQGPGDAGQDAGGAERRIFPRAPIELRVEYRKVNTFFYDYTRNISKGGTFIKTGKPLPEGTQFLFKLVIPHLDEPLTLRGQVKWIGKKKDERYPQREAEMGMGIQFIYETDSERDQVDGKVERLMKEQLGELAYSKLMERS